MLSACAITRGSKKICDGIGDDVGDNIGDDVGDGVGDDIGDGVGDNVGDDVGDNVGDDVGLRRIAPLGFRSKELVWKVIKVGHLHYEATL